MASALDLLAMVALLAFVLLLASGRLRRRAGSESERRKPPGLRSVYTVSGIGEALVGVAALASLASHATGVNSRFSPAMLSLGVLLAALFVFRPRAVAFGIGVVGITALGLDLLVNGAPRTWPVVILTGSSYLLATVLLVPLRLLAPVSQWAPRQPGGVTHTGVAARLLVLSEFAVVLADPSFVPARTASGLGEPGLLLLMLGGVALGMVVAVSPRAGGSAVAAATIGATIVAAGICSTSNTARCYALGDALIAASAFVVVYLTVGWLTR